MKCLIVLLAAAAVASAQLVYPHAPAHGLRTQYHAQDELGSYSFGYSGGPSSKVESRHGDVTQGAFSYVDAHGLTQSRSYVADSVHGFRVAGTDIPVDSNTPLAVAPLAHHVAPVAYSAAPLAHHVAPVAYSAAPLAYSVPVAHHGAALSSVLLARKKRQAIYPFAHSYAYPYSFGHAYSAVTPYHAAVAHPVALHHPYPQDTPEVAAAKINNAVQYNHEALRNSLGRKKRSVYSYTAALPGYHAYSYSAPAPLAYTAPVAHAYTAPVAHAYSAHVPTVYDHNPYPQDTPEVAAAKINNGLQYNAEALRNAHGAHLY